MISKIMQRMGILETRATSVTQLKCAYFFLCPFKQTSDERENRRAYCTVENFCSVWCERLRVTENLRVHFDVKQLPLQLKII